MKSLANSKWIVLVLVFLMTVTRSDGQVLIALVFGDKLNSDKLEFGLTVGTGTSTILNLEQVKYTSKLNLGLYFNIKLAQQFWFLHTGAVVKSTYGATNLKVSDLGDPNLNEAFASAEVTREFGIINVPALARFHTKNGWGIELGPQFSLRTKVDDIFRVDYDNIRDKLFYRSDMSDIYKRITIEGVGGIYKKLRKGEGVTLNFRYNLSLYDILKDNTTGVSQYHSVFSFFVGIPIGKDKKKEEKEETESDGKP